MQIRSKFDGGKLYNRCNRGSWHSRCFGGALRKNFGPAWPPIIWHKVTGEKPGTAFTDHYRQRSHHLLNSLRSKQTPDVKTRMYKRKLTFSTQSASKKARIEYGEEALDTIADINAETLKSECDKYFCVHIGQSGEKLKKIEVLTISQSQSVTWIEERKKRITSLCFGDVVSRSENRNVYPLVKKIIYNKFAGNRHTRFGLQQESISIMEYVR